VPSPIAGIFSPLEGITRCKIGSVICAAFIRKGTKIAAAAPPSKRVACRRVILQDLSLMNSILAHLLHNASRWLSST
jgi:hypothetical protein